MSEDLKAEFDAARMAGDHHTMARVGRLLYPEPGAPRPDGYTPVDTTPVPSTPRRDFAAERTAIRAEMLRPFADPGLQDKLDQSYRDEYAAKDGRSDDPTTTLTREAVRPELPADVTWDDALVRVFEATAPGSLILEHTAAEALREVRRSGERWDDAGAAGTALEDRWGIEEAGRLAEDAMAYAKAHVKPEIQANLRTQGLLYHPDVIRAAALLWRRQHAGR
jgi:hypothetical protein